MKKTVLLLLLAFSASGFLRAQITADSVPAGMYAMNPNVSLSVSPCGTYDSTSFDINCDNVADFTLILYKGYTAIDGANILSLRVLNDTFDICKDTTGMSSGSPGQPHFYNAGDPLVCPPGAIWASDGLYRLSEYGCMLCAGPPSLQNKFIAYRKPTYTGWIKISFNINDAGSCVTAITATIPSVLAPCLNTSVQTLPDAGVVSISPNPFSTQAVLTMATPLNDARLEMYNAFGQLVNVMEQVSGTSVRISREQLPAGVYFVRVVENGVLVAGGKVMIGE